MKTTLNRSAAAGVLICMGCSVSLKVGGGIPGAVLFSAGLWFVVNFDAELFTGRVARNDYDPLQKVIMLVMNVIGAAVCGILASLCLPEIREAAQKIAAAELAPRQIAIGTPIASMTKNEINSTATISVPPLSARSHPEFPVPSRFPYRSYSSL